MRKGIDGHDRKLVAAECPNIHVTLEYDEEGKQQVILNGKNVNGFIRTEEVGNMASATSVYPVVRTKLVELQRKLAESTDVIMDGRDIGTCVLPNAQVKIYLTASSKTRAQRRYDELTAKGVFCDFDEIEKDIIDRDYRDMHRETSPLKQAEDAVLVDSSEMNIDQVVEAIRSIYEPYVLNTAVTSEYYVPTVEEFRARITRTLERYPYIVALKDGQIIGYIYASPLSPRHAYSWAAETSIYIRQNMRRTGAGSRLYKALSAICMKQHVLNLYARIAFADPEDEFLVNASARFHQAIGFSKAAEFHRGIP